LPQADMYISECHGWTAENLDTMKAIADGTRQPEHLQEGRKAQRAIELEEETLFNTHIPVFFCDIPAANELSTEDDGTDTDTKVLNLFMDGDYATARDQMLVNAQKNAAYLEKKDRWIANEIQQRIPEFIQQLPPEMQKKQKLKVVVQMGSVHTPILHHLAPHMKTNRIGDSIMSFSNYDELVRRFRFKKEIPSTLAGKALLEWSIRDTYNNELKNTPDQKITQLLRKIVSPVSEIQLQRFSVALFQARFFDFDSDVKAAFPKVFQQIFAIDIEKEISNIHSQ
ncbi:MAG TPA: hypothetical protein VJB65_04450, partial [Patescibacteria group bacterium]|nr:hypothetical protein [Patescibacteria group bacterium]